MSKTNVLSRDALVLLNCLAGRKYGMMFDKVQKKFPKMNVEKVVEECLNHNHFGEVLIDKEFLSNGTHSIDPLTYNLFATDTGKHFVKTARAFHRHVLKV